MLSVIGGNALQPDKAGGFDLEDDGLVDFEIAKDQTLVRQHNGSFTVESLPMNPAAIPQCRPPVLTQNLPRVLARMTPDAPVQVFKAINSGAAGTTRVLVCDRQGVPLSDQTSRGCGRWGRRCTWSTSTTITGRTWCGCSRAAIRSWRTRADVAASGAVQVVTGNPSNTLTNRAIASVTSQQTADNVELAIAVVTVTAALARSPYVSRLLQRPAPAGPPRPQYVPNGADGERLALPRGPNGELAPSSPDPHTQIGWAKGRKGDYVQTREFGPNGEPVKQVDWTNHGRPAQHTDPHVHDYAPNPTGGTHKLGAPRRPRPGELE